MCKQKLGSQRCEKGFTLLDSLLQLMILVLFAHFFLLFFSWYAQKNNGMFNNDELHWELFAFQLQKELTHTENFTYISKPPKIIYSTDRGDLSVSNMSGELRRGLGYQPLLFGVAQLTFDYSEYILKMNVKFHDGTERSREYIVANFEE